jgi:hypothetical protein
MVTFFYSNDIKIIQAKEDETVNATRLIEALAEKSPRMKLFELSGAEGVGHDPWVQIYEGERIDHPGELNFWMDGIHYAIVGDLSFDEMVKIAISMLES